MRQREQAAARAGGNQNGQSNMSLSRDMNFAEFMSFFARWLDYYFR